MHIIVPMCGTGERFKQAGYELPKPLLVVDGMPVIEHIVNLFPSEKKFTFVCNKDHLKTTNMREVLQRVCPTGEIVSADPHKLGPVHSVLQVFEDIDDMEEIIVNYCDFSTHWNYEDFLNDTRSRKADGCVICYRGFHPHMLGTDNYAFVKETDRWLEAIQEKQPFTDNRMAEYASNGTYYFARGSLLKRYFMALMEAEEKINNEYYVSMVYNRMAQDGLKISVYEIEHMLQWGTPKDLREYESWSDCFRRLSSGAPERNRFIENGICVIPMAGRGSRFADRGYSEPKPLIDVDGMPMVVRATLDLPRTRDYVFVCLAEMLEKYEIESALLKAFPNAHVVKIPEVTEGQACTVVEGLMQSPLQAESERPLLVGACDNGMLFDEEKFFKLIADDTIDAVAFTFRGHPPAGRNPQQYGWVEVDEVRQLVKRVSVKVPISDNPAADHGIVGAFYFKKAKYLNDALGYLRAYKIKVNNEFYIDSAIGGLVALGHKVAFFDVDHYVCWGTPDELNTYNYWQTFFTKCKWHPYVSGTVIGADHACNRSGAVGS